MDLLKTPLSNVCNVSEHDELILSLLFKCKFQQPSEASDHGWAEALIFPDHEARDILIYVFQQIGNPEEQKDDDEPETVVKAEEGHELAAKEEDGLEKEEQENGANGARVTDAEEDLEPEEEVEEEEEEEDVGVSEGVDPQSLFEKEGVSYNLDDTTFRILPLTDLAVRFAVRLSLFHGLIHRANGLFPSSSF